MGLVVIVVVAVVVVVMIVVVVVYFYSVCPSLPFSPSYSIESLLTNQKIHLLYKISLGKYIAVKKKY